MHNRNRPRNVIASDRRGLGRREGYEATEIHHAFRWRGCVAICGARAAIRRNAAHRHPYAFCEARRGTSSPRSGFSPGIDQARIVGRIVVAARPCPTRGARRKPAIPSRMRRLGVAIWLGLRVTLLASVSCGVSVTMSVVYSTTPAEVDVSFHYHSEPAKVLKVQKTGVRP
jgi:hypothetical protein